MITIKEATGLSCRSNWNNKGSYLNKCDGTNLTVIPKNSDDTGSLRVVFTYLHIEITSWNEDDDMMIFLTTQTPMMLQFYNALGEFSDDNPSIRSFHLVHKHDDRAKENYVKVFADKPEEELLFLKGFEGVSCINGVEIVKLFV